MSADGGTTYARATGRRRPSAARATATATRTLVGQHVVISHDLAASGGMEEQPPQRQRVRHLDGATDANGDGCIDIVDVAAAQRGIWASPPRSTRQCQSVAPSAHVIGLHSQPSSTTSSKARAALAYTKTFTVNYAG